jgi:putative ABC transport system substrate-binding protein
MRRREFITLIGGAATWPFTARAQQGKVPLVGVLIPFEKGDDEGERRQNAFQNGLEQFGWRNGQNMSAFGSKADIALKSSDVCF